MNNNKRYGLILTLRAIHILINKLRISTYFSTMYTILVGITTPSLSQMLIDETRTMPQSMPQPTATNRTNPVHMQRARKHGNPKLKWQV